MVNKKSKQQFKAKPSVNLDSVVQIRFKKQDLARYRRIAEKKGLKFSQLVRVLLAYYADEMDQNCPRERIIF